MTNEQDFQVNVPTVCSRTGKERTISLPLREVPEFVARRDAKVANAKAILAFIENIPPNECPDLIVIYKGQGDICANVDRKSDSGVGGALNLALNKQLFAVTERKARKKAGSAETTVEAEPELEAVEAVEAVEAFEESEED